MIFPLNPPDPPSISRGCRIFARAAAGLVLLVGLLVLAGWALGVEWLRSPLPGYASMKVNTALALALGGAALLARSSPLAAAPRRRWTTVFAAPVVALGALTLAQYLSGLNLGIDHWSLRHPALFEAAASDPARMAPATAYCLMLIGAALLVSVFPRPAKGDWRPPTMAAFGATAVTVGALALAGYASRASFGAPFLNKAGPAIHTAVAFLLLGSALLALVRGEGGLRWALDGAVTTGFAAGVGVMLLAAGASFNFTERLLTSATGVAHTQEVLKEIKEVKTRVAEVESSQRGYIITGDEELLRSREGEKAALAKDLTGIQTLTVDNARQQERLIPLEALIQQRLDFDDRTIVVRRQNGFAAAQSMIDSGIGIRLSRQIRDALDEMESEEDALLGQRQIATSATSTTTFLLLPVEVFLSMTILSVGLFFLNAGVDERSRAEADLHASDERLRIVTENAHVGLVMVDRERRYTFANAGYSEILGLPPADLIGRRVEDVLPTLYPTQIRPHLDRAFAGERVAFEVHDATLGNDRYRTVRYEPTKVDGEVRFVVAVIMDVTERKQAEATRFLLAAIIDSSHDAIVGKDLNGVVTSWNAGAERMFGYSADEMIGQSITRLIPAARQSEEEMILSRVRSGQVVAHFDTVRLPRSGRALDVSVTVSPIKDAAGRVIGASKIARDITGHRLAEEALRASEERFRSLADAIPQLAWIARADGFIFWYNRRWYEYTGTEPAQMEGWGWQQVHDPAVLPQVMLQWVAAIATGEAFEMEFPLRGADARFRRFLTRAVPLKDAGGRVLQWFGTNTDVDELKRVEDSLRQSEAALEQRVIERTSQLAAANSALEGARARAETADRAKSAFLASMSHELRTPLNGIIGFSEFLIDQKPGPLNPKQGEYLNDVLNGARHLLQLINDVLDLAKVEAGKIDLRLEEFSPAKAIEGVCAIIRSIAIKKGITVEWSVAADLARVTLDAQKFKQIFYNLLSNAVKFTGSGGRVAIRALSPAGGQFVVTVSDTGAGILPEDLTRLYREFEQLGSAEQSAGGTGLGLALTRKFVEAHGGSIAVESEYGQGTIFRVTLPTKGTAHA